MSGQTFKLQPSLVYSAVLMLMVGMSIIIVLMLSLPKWLQGAMIFFLLIYGSTVIRRYGFLKSKSSIIALKKSAANKWEINTRAGVYEGELLGDSTITTLVSVLRFNVGKRLPLVCIVWKFSLPQDQYRQLLVALKS